MTDEKLITAALKVDADPIHLPDGLLAQIEQEAERLAPARPKQRRLRPGASLEILAAGLVLGALLTALAMGAFDRQPTAPPDGPKQVEGPAPPPEKAPAPVTLPKLSLADVVEVNIRPTDPFAGTLSTERTDPLTAVIDAFNQATATHLYDATSPGLTVLLELRDGQTVQFTAIDAERVVTMLNDLPAVIRSPDLVQALEQLPAKYREGRPGSIAIELADGSGGYIVRGPTTMDVTVTLLVAGQVRQRVDAPVQDGWYTATLDPIRADELADAQVVVTGANGYEDSLPLPTSPHLGTYSHQFAELFVTAGDRIVEIQGKTTLPEGRFLVEVRAAGERLTSQEVQLTEGSRVEIPVPGGVPEKAEVWFISTPSPGAGKIELVLPIIYRR